MQIGLVGSVFRNDRGERANREKPEGVRGEACRCNSLDIYKDLSTHLKPTSACDACDGRDIAFTACLLPSFLNFYLAM